MSKKKLLVVESVHKSKSIQAFLGPGWIVKPSIGHIRELLAPKRIPATKKDDYYPYSINTKTFDMLFEVTADRKKVVAELKAALSQVDEVYWGTDPDREGTSIAWHLQQVLNPKVPTYRVSWQEVTKKAVEEGIKNRKAINQQEVDASLARAAYDRLFGFAISGNVQKTLRERSAGRVQSPALRFIVEREKERLAFRIAPYLSLTGTFTVGAAKMQLDAKLLTLGKDKIAVGSSFDSKGVLAPGFLLLDENNLPSLSKDLNRHTYDVSSVAVKPYSRKAPGPYTTSTFQQDVGTRLRLSSKQLMNIAQRLFDNSYISYMRTDSPHLGDEALAASYAEAKRLFPGKVPAQPTAYKAKGQGGHEAIRPVCNAKGVFAPPASVKAQLDAIDAHAFKVYEAIYNRTVASQMSPAVGFTTTVKISSLGTDEASTAVFGTGATTYTDLGWMALTKPVEEEEGSANVISDKIEKGDAADLIKLTPKEHKTSPPPRYTEPSLVQKLSDTDIGRPSTFASIVTVNQDRGYVKKKGGQLYPTWAGMKVAQYLEGKIPNFVAYEASARMEQELDKIEAGTMKKDPFLRGAWKLIQADVLSLNDNVNWDEVNALSTIDLDNGYAVRVNAYGAFLESATAPLDSQGRKIGAKLSEDENVAELDFSDPEVCRKLYEDSQNRVDARELGVLPSGNYQGWTVTARDGKYGAFVQALPPETVAAFAKGEKAPAKAPAPVNQPLPEGVELGVVELADIEALFADVKLPRWSPDKKWLVGIGKKGAYMGRKATPRGRPVFRSLDEAHDPKTITFAEVKVLWDEAEGAKKAAPAKKAPAKKAAAKKPAAKKAPAKKAAAKKATPKKS